jgi:predicted ATPase
LAQQLGEELLELAQQNDETPIYVLAHYTLGFVYLCLGELRTAQRNLEEGVALYTPSQRRYPTFRAGQDPGVACHVYAAWTLWLLGYPDRALTHIHDALALATEFNHPFTYAFARLTACLLGQFLQEAQKIVDHAEADVHFSAEQGFPVWLAANIVIQGWAITAQKQQEEGVMQMHKGLADWRACSAEFFVPYFLALLAEGYSVTAQYEEGLAILREAFSLVDSNGERWYEAELYRLRGQLLLQQSADNVAEAISCFHQAMTIARSQSAKSLELRAATSLAQVWQCQGKRDEARGLLAPVYDGFTEGFDTADLKRAKLLLAELVEGVG